MGSRLFCRIPWINRPATVTAVVILSMLITMQAQDRRSGISGVVRDVSGSVVQQAAVLVENPANGERREAWTDVHGAYRLMFLEPGTYGAEVSKPGFRTAKRTGILLEIGQAAIVDFQLLVEGVAESVEVVAEALSIGLSSSMLTSVTTGQTVRELPLNGRDYAQLATLDAGIPPALTQTRGVNNGYGLQLSFAGSRPYQNSFLLDGVSMSGYNSSTPGSVNGVNLGVDAIAEFAVITSGFGAQYGRAAGGVLHASTRAGGNDFHGGLSYFHRNDNLDARNFFDGAKMPEFRRHQYSVYAGGPIMPNRIFFFVNFEGLREERGRTQIDTTISDTARSGRLASGCLVNLDAAIRPLLELYPRPNAQVFGDTGLFVFENSESGLEDFATGRIDANLGDRDKLFSRWTVSDGLLSDQTSFALNERRNASRMHSGTAEQTHTFSATTVNTARLGLLRTLTRSGETRSLREAAQAKELLSIPGASGVALIAVTGLSDLPGGTGTLDSDFHAFTSYQFSNELTKASGSHLLQMGLRAERTHFNTDSRTRTNGEYRFLGVQDLLINRPERFRGQFPGSDTVRGHRQWILSGYLQDSWKPAGRLTMDLGLRYEWASVPSEVNGKIANLDELTSPAVRQGGPLFDNPAGRNFAPRAGIAWRVRKNGKTMVRAGYGLYHDLILSHFLLLSGVRNPPFFMRGEVRRLQPGGFPTGGYQELIERGGREARVERFPRQIKQPAVHQWNFSIEQGIGETVLRMSYAGSRGVHLSAVTEDANLAIPVLLNDGRLFFPENAEKLNPNFSIIRNRTFEADSFYHGLQAQVRKRYGQGLQMQAGYGLSKSIDDSSGYLAPTEALNSLSLPVNGTARFNRGLSAHDVRHNLTGAVFWDMASPGAGKMRSIFGGWTAGALATASSGQPFSVRMGYDSARTLTGRPGADSGQRPDPAPGTSKDPVTWNPGQWVDPTAFHRPAPGFLGKLGRNTVTGPGFFSVDVSLGRKFPFERGGRAGILELRAESFNLLNRANFRMPEPDRMELFTATGMREDFARVTSAHPGRELQFSLRLRF
jgi:hypothetical protein